MKVFRRILFILLSTLLLVIGTLAGITYAYKSETKEYMINQLNAHLKTKVIVDSKNIEFSLFKYFPYASLNFKKVIMLGAPVNLRETNVEDVAYTKKEKNILPDTLFSMDDISFQFNIIDILGENFIVRKLVAETGNVVLRMGTDGTRNWDVWKESSEKTSASHESVFKLDKFILNNISFSYYDPHKNKDIVAVIHSGTMQGEFTNSKYDLAVSGDLFMNHFFIDSVNYLSGKPVKLKLNLHVDNNTDRYAFSNTQFSVADMKVSVEGNYVSGDDSDNADIYLKGKDMDIQSVLSLLPEKYYDEISDYDSEGEFYFNAHINGRIDSSHSPEVKAKFGISKSDITQLSSGITLKDVRVVGDYFSSSESSKYFLDLKSFSASLAHGKIAGKIRMDNYSKPNVSATLYADLLLEDVRHLLKMDTIWDYPITALSGAVKIDMRYKGEMNKSGKYTRSDFENMTLSGNMNLENAGVKIKNSSLSFDSINGSFLLNNNNVTINSFSGKTPRSDFYMKGILKNILAYSFSDDAGIDIDAVFQSDKFDLNEFLLNQKISTKRDTVYNVSFSPRVNFKLNSNIGYLRFRKFRADNVRGVFQLHDRKLIANPISFNTMDGSVTASGVVDGTTNNALKVTCQASLKQLNISKLFDELEDFGQSTMTHENIYGIGTADIMFSSVWASDLTIDPAKIYMRSNLTIDKGELINFKPLRSLSKYIALSDLEAIKFSSLKNQIEIKNKTIYIPKMDIQSSALNLTLSGTHTFNNEIDYHFRVLMSDLLFQKARKAKKENSEFGIIEDDKSGKTSLFISMTGTVDHPVFKYDKQSAKQNFNNKIAEEKHTIKQILKDEFGRKKKQEESTQKMTKPKENDKFIIKWDDGEKNNAKSKDDDF